MFATVLETPNFVFLLSLMFFLVFLTKTNA